VPIGGTGGIEFSWDSEGSMVTPRSRS